MCCAVCTPDPARLFFAGWPIHRGFGPVPSFVPPAALLLPLLPLLLLPSSLSSRQQSPRRAETTHNMALLQALALLLVAAVAAIPTPAAAGPCRNVDNAKLSTLICAVASYDLANKVSQYSDFNYCNDCVAKLVECELSECAACPVQYTYGAYALSCTQACFDCANSQCMPAFRECAEAPNAKLVVAPLFKPEYVYGPILGLLAFFFVAFALDREITDHDDAVRRYGGSIFTPEPVSCCLGCWCPTCLLASSISTARGLTGFIACLPLCCCLSVCPCFGHCWAADEQDKINVKWGGKPMCLTRWCCMLFFMPCVSAQMSRAVTAHALTPMTSKDAAVDEEQRTQTQSAEVAVAVATPVAVAVAVEPSEELGPAPHDEEMGKSA